MAMNNVIEDLARLEHQQWAHWTKYMLDNLTPENIERWKKRIETDYSDLTSKEQDSDREWAIKVMEIVTGSQDIQIRVCPVCDDGDGKMPGTLGDACEGCRGRGYVWTIPLIRHSER